MAKANAPRGGKPSTNHSQKTPKLTRKSSPRQSGMRGHLGELPPERHAEDFTPIAKLLASNPPPWLAAHLHLFHWSVWRNWVLASEQPTRRQIIRTLADVDDAAKTLLEALGSPIVLEFLGAAGDTPFPLPALGPFFRGLIYIRDRATKASQSSTLINAEGKTKSGRGRAYADAAISPRAYCALVIAETWKHFSGRYPSPQNLKAVEAADEFWRLSVGAPKKEVNNPESRWEDYFEEARAAETAPFRRAYCEELVEAPKRFNSGLLK